MKRKDGGRGLVSVTECVREEELGSFEYVKASDEWMMEVVGKELQIGETKKEHKKRVEKDI